MWQSLPDHSVSLLGWRVHQQIVWHQVQGVDLSIKILFLSIRLKNWQFIYFVQHSRGIFHTFIQHKYSSYNMHYMNLRCPNSHDRSKCHHPYGLGRHIEQGLKYSELQKWWQLSNGLDDFKMALCVCPNRMDNGIHSDHSYFEIVEKPWCSALTY